MPAPTQGRTVLVRLPDRYERERLRPATVLQAFGPACCNVMVALDPWNDDDLKGDHVEGTSLHLIHGQIDGKPYPVNAYGLSVGEGEGVGNYRWPVVPAAPSPLDLIGPGTRLDSDGTLR